MPREISTLNGYHTPLPGPGNSAIRVASRAAQEFRRGQSKVAARVSAQVGAIWDSEFKIGKARESWANMRPLLVALIDSSAQGSIAAAKRNYITVKVATGYRATVPKVRPTAPDSKHIGRVIDPMGLGMFLHFVKQGDLMADASSKARDGLGRAVGRLVLSAGRDFLNAAAEADPDCQGTRRVTAGTCDFCEMLADEGVGGAGSWHDGCECSAEPVFDASQLSYPSSAADQAVSGAEDITEDDENPVSVVSNAVEDAAKLAANVTDSSSLNAAVAAAARLRESPEVSARIRQLIIGQARANGIDDSLPASWSKDGRRRPS